MRQMELQAQRRLLEQVSWGACELLLSRMAKGGVDRNTLHSHAESLSTTSLCFTPHRFHVLQREKL